MMIQIGHGDIRVDLSVVIQVHAQPLALQLQLWVCEMQATVGILFGKKYI